MHKCEGVCTCARVRVVDIAPKAKELIEEKRTGVLHLSYRCSRKRNKINKTKEKRPERVRMFVCV